MLKPDYVTSHAYLARLKTEEATLIEPCLHRVPKNVHLLFFE